jgi:ElaB/YqjD/DUF883 family membrane-anchored ribosome-binding protein
MQAATETNSEKLTRDLGILVRDGEEFLKSGAHRLTEEARAKLGQAVEAAKATGLKLKEKARKGAQVTDDTIRERPYPFLGVAFGLGLLIGILTFRR